MSSMPPHEDSISMLIEAQRKHIDIAARIEQNLLLYLWGAKNEIPRSTMLAWTGWSKQTLYNKWRKHGISGDG